MNKPQWNKSSYSSRKLSLDRAEKAGKNRKTSDPL
jgi:hypothetical protein